MATSARLDELKKKFDENPRRYFAPLANEYRKLGDLTQAIALCRAHLPNQPGHISGHIVLAQALYEARELGESRQIFEASLDLDPENLIALRYLGDIAREQGEPVQARGWYERVLDADPRNEEIALLLRELDGQATVTDGEDESRVPAFEDVQRHDTSRLRRRVVHADRPRSRASRRDRIRSIRSSPAQGARRRRGGSRVRVA